MKHVVYAAPGMGKTYLIARSLSNPEQSGLPLISGEPTEFLTTWCENQGIFLSDGRIAICDTDWIFEFIIGNLTCNYDKLDVWSYQRKHREDLTLVVTNLLNTARWPKDIIIFTNLKIPSDIRVSCSKKRMLAHLRQSQRGATDEQLFELFPWVKRWEPSHEDVLLPDGKYLADLKMKEKER